MAFYALPDVNHTYFTSDGTYGDAADLIVINTEKWSDSEWEQVENTPDSKRQAIALSISIGE